MGPKHHECPLQCTLLTWIKGSGILSVPCWARLHYWILTAECSQGEYPACPSYLSRSWLPVSLPPCLAAGTLTEMTRMPQPAIIIFLWPPKCTWNKGKINLCHRPYSKINSHAVTELYEKWSYSSTERHISVHYIPSFIGLDSEYSFYT